MSLSRVKSWCLSHVTTLLGYEDDGQITDHLLTIQSKQQLLTYAKVHATRQTNTTGAVMDGLSVDVDVDQFLSVRSYSVLMIMLICLSINYGRRRYKNNNDKGIRLPHTLR